VCLVSFEYPPHIIGGAGTYADTIATGLRHKSIDVFVISRGWSNEYSQKTFRIPTPTVAYWQRIFFMRPALKLLRKLDKKVKFDLIHFNEPHMTFGELNLPTVCTLHANQLNEIILKLTRPRNYAVKDIVDLVLKSPVGYMLDISIAHNADKIICPSPHLASKIKSYCFISDDRINVVPNGIEVKAFDRIPNDYTDVLGKYDLEKENYILYIGRLFPLKGVQFLIKAFKTIKKKCANLKLVIVGAGHFEKYLRSLASEDVVFTGYVRSLRVRKILYENSLVFVLPSFYEAFPMVILEAMACSKAVIASNVGGIPYLVKSGRNGFLLEPGNSASLGRLIEMLYGDEKLRKSLGTSGRKLVEKEFSIEKMIDQTLKVYESLL